MSEAQVQETTNVLNTMGTGAKIYNPMQAVRLQWAEEIYTTMKALALLSTSGAPASSVLDKIASIEYIVDFHQVLDKKIPEYEERNRCQIVQE